MIRSSLLAVKATLADGRVCDMLVSVVQHPRVTRRMIKADCVRYIEQDSGSRVVDLEILRENDPADVAAYKGRELSR